MEGRAWEAEPGTGCISGHRQHSFTKEQSRCGRTRQRSTRVRARGAGPLWRQVRSSRPHGGSVHTQGVAVGACLLLGDEVSHCYARDGSLASSGGKVWTRNAACPRGLSRPVCAGALSRLSLATYGRFLVPLSACPTLPL